MKPSLEIAYAMKRKARKMASGGQVPTDQTLGKRIGYPGFSEGGSIMDDPDYGESEDRRPTQDEAPYEIMTPGVSDDLVDRVMAKRMSQGGRVANGSMTEGLAGMRPNEFDDLVLRDDLESSSDGENNGDFIGNEQEDADRADIVSRVMRSRAKKDRLPNPR